MPFVQLEQYGNRPFLIDHSGKVFSYLEIAERGDRMVSDFPSRSLVFLLCENTVDHIAAYFGLLRKNCVPLLLDAHLEEGALQKLERCYQPDAVISFENGMLVRRKTQEGELWTQNSSPVGRLHPDLALLLSTSGSTGDPKLTRLSYKNLQSNAKAICSYLKIDPSQRAVTNLPMHYTYGLSVIHSYALAGASLLVTDLTMFEEGFWEQMKTQKVTSLAGVPYTWEMLKRLKLTEMDLPDLQVLTQAGGRLPVKLQQYFGEWAERTGRKFYIMYGQTEATARMSYLPPEQCLDKPGSIGIPIPGGRFCLLDETGSEIKENDVQGELIFAGDNVSLGYAECMEDLQKGDENAGVLHTGDLARQDVDGFYYITGRKNRFVKRYGKRISLDHLEQLLGEQIAETAFACTGTDDLVMVYAVKEGTLSSAETDRILEVMKKAGLRGKDLRIKRIDRLPRNTTGKIQYQELTEPVAD